MNKRKIDIWKLMFYIMPVVVIIIFTIIILMPEKSKNAIAFIDLEKIMTDKVSEYYDNNVKGKVIGIDRYIVTLETLEKHNTNISELKRANCSKESFSYVLIEDSTETDLNKIKYSIENHLDCKEVVK